MGRKKLSQSLLCLMNDLPVGTLTRSHAQLSFQYAKEWLVSSRARPISLSMPLQEQPHKGEKVHAYFENLLPDNPTIRHKIVDRLGALSTHPYDLLRVIGADCVGALTFLDEENPIHTEQPGTIPLSEFDIERMLKNVASGQMLGMLPDDEFRISLAGAQEKTALVLEKGRWSKPIGAMPTTHILKLPISNNSQFGPDLSDSVENEFFCMRLIQNLGFKVAEVEMIRFGEVKALAVKRFDRVREKNKRLRLPQEDFCQALGVVSGSKYEEHGGPGIAACMNLLANSALPHDDRSTFMRTQLIFWLLAAIDAHAKNYSIFLKPEGFYLAPVYDVLSAIPYFGQGNIHRKKIKMAMALQGKNRHYFWDNILPRHFVETAKRVGFDVGEMEKIIEQTKLSFPVALNKTISELPQSFPRKIVEPIKKYSLLKLDRL